MLKLALLARRLTSQRCPELSLIYFYPDLSGKGFIQTNTFQGPKIPGSMYIRSVEPHEPRECKIFQHQSLLNMLLKTVCGMGSGQMSGWEKLLLSKWNERGPLRHDLDKITIHQSSHHIVFQKKLPHNKISSANQDVNWERRGKEQEKENVWTHRDCGNPFLLRSALTRSPTCL